MTELPDFTLQRRFSSPASSSAEPTSTSLGLFPTIIPTFTDEVVSLDPTPFTYEPTPTEEDSGSDPTQSVSVFTDVRRDA